MSNESRVSKRAQRRAIRQQGRKEFKEGVKGALKSGGKAIIRTALVGNPGKENMSNLITSGKAILKGATKALINDLDWFTKYEDATREMIGLNFNVVQGATNVVENPSQFNVSKATGFCTAGVGVHLVIGDNSDRAISAGYNRLFTAIRQANAGAVNWTKVDLEAYIVNIRNIIALYSMGARALRELNRTSLLVRENPVANFAAMNLDYNTFRDNAANLRNYLINIKVKLASYAAPDIPLLQRTQWMFRGAFWDTDDIKHQTYYFRPINYIFLQVNEDGQYELSTEEFTPTLNGTQTGWTYAYFITAMDKAIEYLTSLDKAGIISGDIAKAYGLSNLFYLDDVPGVGDAPIQGFNEEVLTEIENAWNPVDDEFPFDDFADPYIADDGIITQNLVIKAISQDTSSGAIQARKSSVVNMYKPNISNAEVIMATRLQTLYDSSYHAMGYGSEIFSAIYYYCFDVKSTNMYMLRAVPVTSIEPLSITMSTTYTEVLYWLSVTAASRFRYSPRMLPKVSGFPVSSSTLVTRILSDMFDYNVYAFINSPEELVAISNVANQSLLYTPLLLRASNNVIEY